jgi:hypothetical protein
MGSNGSGDVLDGTTMAVNTLDPLQRKAATGTGNIHLVLAGPGGKTTTLAGRFVNLVGQGIDRRRILALTFTKKAADEMRSRIATPRPDNDYPSGVSVTPHRGEHAARAISWRSRFSEGTAEKIQRAVCVPRVPQRASIIPGAGITLSSVRCWCMRSTNSS